MLRCSYARDEILNSAMIFHAWRALNTATHIHSVWHNGLDGMANILSAQTARKNKESGEGQCCSCDWPITGPSSSAAQIGMVCINEHVAIRKQRHIFRAKVCMSRKHSNHAKRAGQFMRDFRGEIPVQLNASHQSGLRSLPNLRSVPVNENTDRLSFSRQCPDNFPANAGFNVTRTLRIKV